MSNTHKRVLEAESPVSTSATYRQEESNPCSTVQTRSPVGLDGRFFTYGQWEDIHVPAHPSNVTPVPPHFESEGPYTTPSKWAKYLYTINAV